jgi:hypothetical protein
VLVIEHSPELESPRAIAALTKVDVTLGVLDRFLKPYPIGQYSAEVPPRYEP